MTRTVAQPDALWERHARQFERMGPPIRPSSEDLDVIRSELRGRLVRGEASNVLVMGVTPDFADMGDHALAADRNPAMIRGVWPGFGCAPDSYVCADWLHLPVPDASRDVVLCDGGLTLLGFPDGWADWAREASRVLAPGGVVVVRVFVLPAEPESVEAVLGDLEAGGIEGFHTFRWRLAMASQGSAEAGVGVHDVWTVWDRLGRRALERAPDAGWSGDVVRTIEAYRDLTARLHFPTLSDVRAVLEPYFVERRAVQPGYPIGARCPTLVLARRRR